MAFTVKVIDRDHLDREAGRASDSCAGACQCTCDNCGNSSIGVSKGQVDAAAAGELSPLED